MRNNKLALILLVVVVTLCLCTAFVACNDKGNGDDGNKVIPGVTTITAPDDGIEDVDYRVTVLYPDGKTPVVGVEVQLFFVDDDDEAYCGATTGSDGVAVLKTSKELEYYVVLVGVPEGYVYEDEDVIFDNETSKTVVIQSEVAKNQYNVSVFSEGGMPMNNITVSLKNENVVVGSKVTDKNGTVSVKVEELGEYTVELGGLPTGYSVKGGTIKTSADSNNVAITVVSSVIKENMPSNLRYQMDDIMYDFSLTTSDGTTFTLSEVLKEKKFVMINFWATWCSPCKKEFEDIQKAYERYQDDMAIIAISTSDSSTAVATFKAEYSPTLTFDMSGKDDVYGLYGRFSSYFGSTVPGTVFIDRYGKICNFIQGAGTEALFKQEFARYTAEDYVQVAYDPSNDEIPVEEGDKPDVKMPSSSNISEKISPTVSGTYSEVGDGEIWPWLLGTDENNNNIFYAGNINHNNTEARVTYEFTIADGQFLTFDYFVNTEDIGNADIVSLYIDGTWMCDLDRVSGGWKTKYLYTPRSASDAESKHTLIITYVKDSSDGVYLTGDEMVAIKNVRTVTQGELVGDVNILREASWNYTEKDGIEQYTEFITPVYNEEDGYYHVGTKDGPYLLANLGGATHYNNYSVSQLSSGGFFKLAGLYAQAEYITEGPENPPAGSYIEYSKGYAWMAVNSNLPNYCYVDKTLKNTLDVMVKEFSRTVYNGSNLGRYYNKNTWLELCNYVENYSGNGIGNILEGICNKEAIEAKGDNQANHVVVDKTLVPRGIIHKYTAPKSGAYRIYSIIPDEYASQQGGYIHIESDNLWKSEDASKNFDQYVTFEEGKTYYIGVAFDLPGSWGELDFYIQYLGESYDYFTYCTDGSYTFLYDDNDNIVYDKNGQVVFVPNKNDGLEVGLGTDGYYHQKLADGTIDMGANSYIWIDMLDRDYNADPDQYTTILYASLESLASGKVGVQGLDCKFFDLTGEGDEDYSDYILDICKKLKEDENADKSAKTYGMVKADAKLVNILKKALARIDHDSDESWLGLAFYHEHLGKYPAE